MGQLPLHAQAEVQGVWSLIKRIGQIRTRLVKVDITKGEVTIVGIELGHQIRTNAGKDGEQIRGRKGGRIFRETQPSRSALIRDRGTRACPSASAQRKQRLTLVFQIYRV